MAIARAGSRDLITFQKQVLSAEFWAEGAAAGDFNHDDRMDVVVGPYWYTGPAFTERHEFRSATNSFVVKRADGTENKIPGFEGALGKQNAYSDNFLTFTHDFNGDGWVDILVIGFPGEQTWWFENPKGAAGHWKRHLALDVTDNESPAFLDLTGDGIREIVCSSKGAYGWAAPDPGNPTRPWTWHALSPNKNYHKYTHGLGAGDVNGDGRPDLLEKDGWWEQPDSLAGDPVWRHHAFAFGTGGAQMFAYDVDGDSRNDVITSVAAHGFGLAWYQNVPDGDGGITFKEHVFMNATPAENRYGVKFSQLHGLALGDIDGDGLKDIITGKRFWAHGPTGDAEPNEPAVLYWFQLVRRDGSALPEFVPHRVDDDSGVGTQVMAVDVTGDRRLDIVVGNKKGAFVHRQVVRRVSDVEWEAAQPKPLAEGK
jgi:hypothetical protein